MSPILLLAIFVSVTILLVGLVFLASGPGGGEGRGPGSNAARQHYGRGPTSP